jgi:WD40 repeat protein
VIFELKGNEMRIDGSRAPGYDAFISYKPAANGELAAALQNWLERLATPWYRPRSLRIFRDYTSLSASEDLWESLKEALSSSSHFILIASPEAATSSWVNREMEWWRDNKPAGTLYIVLASGELCWDDEHHHWDRQRTSALPPAAYDMLKQPLWVDLTAVLPTAELGPSNLDLVNKVAQIAAPLRGEKKDDLVGDHLTYYQRARRQRTGGVAALAVLTVAAVVAAILAVIQTISADQQRGIAVSGQFAAQSEVFDATDPVGAAKLATAAWHVAHSPLAYESLLDVLAQPDRAVMTADSRYVTAVAFNRNGTILATASQDGTARLWNVATHQQIGGPMTAGGLSATAVAFSPGGTILATADNDGTARLWDVATHQQIGEPMTANGDVYAVAFNRGGTMLATASDGGAQLWDVATQQKIGNPMTAGHESVYAVAFSPNGTTLATAGEDGTARLWDVATQQQIGESMTADNQPVQAVAFRPDGAILATAGYDGTVRLWDVSTYRQLGDR